MQFLLGDALLFFVQENRGEAATKLTGRTVDAGESSGKVDTILVAIRILECDLELGVGRDVGGCHNAVQRVDRGCKCGERHDASDKVLHVVDGSTCFCRRVSASCGAQGCRGEESAARRVANE